MTGIPPGNFLLNAGRFAHSETGVATVIWTPGIGFVEGVIW